MVGRDDGPRYMLRFASNRIEPSEKKQSGRGRERRREGRGETNPGYITTKTHKTNSETTSNP